MKKMIFAVFFVFCAATGNAYAQMSAGTPGFYDHSKFFNANYGSAAGAGAGAGISNVLNVNFDKTEKIQYPVYYKNKSGKESFSSVLMKSRRILMAQIHYAKVILRQA